MIRTQALNKEQCLNAVNVDGIYSTNDATIHSLQADQLRQTLTTTLTDWKGSKMTTNNRRSSAVSSGVACVVFQ